MTQKMKRLRIWVLASSTSLRLMMCCTLAMLAGLSTMIINSPAAIAQPPIYTMDDPHKIIRVTIPMNKSTTVQLGRGYADVLVGNSEIADIVPLTTKSIYILGKKIGATRLVVLDEGKELLGVIEIEVSYDVSELERQINAHVRNGRINVSSVNGKVLLTGTAHDATGVASAMTIAGQFAPKESISNAITVESAQQVLLEVRFVEVSRNADRDLGINWAALSRTPGNFAATTGAAFLGSSVGPVFFPFAGGTTNFPSGNTPFGTFLARVFNNGTRADVVIQALEERGLARRLAQPNLVALSGDTANFLAGGEFPFPVPQSEDTITIQFKKFGVGLAFTPTVLADGQINLKIEPEVSDLDPANSVTVRGSTIPGLVVRRASTTIELRDGQSFAMAGLLQFNNRKAKRQLPWIGQVPILGTLFRSASFQKNETDLVIIVTPRLVKPKIPGERLVTPLEKSIPANDVDFFLLGKEEKWKTRVRRAQIPAGHIIDLEDYADVNTAGGKLHGYK